MTKKLIIVNGSCYVRILTVSDPWSVIVTSSGGTTVLSGSDVTLNCTVELGPELIVSELSLLVVDVQLSKDGITGNLLDSLIRMSGSTIVYSTLVKSFGRHDSGNYSCVATVRPQPFSVYLHGTGEMSNHILVTTGSYLYL